MSIRAVRICGLTMVALYTLTLTICGTLPHSVGLVLLGIVFIVALGERQR